MCDLAQKLESSFFGLSQLKEELLDYLTLPPPKKGWTLLLAGPAGCGKSFIAQALARLLNRPLVRIDLGGQSRASYLTGMTGLRAIQLSQKLVPEVVSQPIILLDRVDRISSDEEATLPHLLHQLLEQRSYFDDYLQQQLKLEHAIILLTAQELEPLPASLLQRVAAHQLPSYTRPDKKAIAQHYLIPQILQSYHAPPVQLQLEEQAWEQLFNCYTSEAGVHELKLRLERLLLRLLRTHPGELQLYLKAEQLFPILGAPVPQESYPRQSGAEGVVIGVAWSEDGGCLLPIEVTLLSGEGNLQTTGKLGETLKESIQVALAVAKGLALERSYDHEFFSSRDIYLHFPESSIPKDGPSAGLSILIALLSAIFRRPIPPDWGLTGELTLKGIILPIGGLREKLLVLQQHHFSCFVIPEANRPDYLEMGEEAPATPQVIFINSVRDILPRLFPQEQE